MKVVQDMNLQLLEFELNDYRYYEVFILSEKCWKHEQAKNQYTIAKSGSVMQ